MRLESTREVVHMKASDQQSLEEVKNLETGTCERLDQGLQEELWVLQSCTQCAFLKGLKGYHLMFTHLAR